MSKLPPLPQALIAGGVAALLTSVLIFLLSETGLFIVMGVPIAVPIDAGSWFAWRTVWGAVFGLVFLVPLLTAMSQWVRGLLVAVLPLAKLFLYDYPHGQEGWFGINLGLMLPLAAILLWLIWGLLAGWLLERWHFGRGPLRPAPPGEAA